MCIRDRILAMLPPMIERKLLESVNIIWFTEDEVNVNVKFSAVNVFLKFCDTALTIPVSFPAVGNVPSTHCSMLPPKIVPAIPPVGAISSTFTLLLHPEITVPVAFPTIPPFAEIFAPVIVDETLMPLITELFAVSARTGPVTATGVLKIIFDIEAPFTDLNNECSRPVIE